VKLFSRFGSRGSMRHIGTQLERIADAMEIVVSEQFGHNMRPPKADTSGPEPETSYVNEENDAMRELAELYARRVGKEPEDAEA